MTSADSHSLDAIASKILFVRGCRVMLDTDLASLYGVETRALIQAVKRNPERFPEDFMFCLNNQEVARLRSQIVISNIGRGGRRTPPYVFTEQGVAMLSTVLNSPQAIAVNIQIMRIFVRLRALLSSNKELAIKLEKLEQKFESHDEAILNILQAIQQLMTPEEPKKRPIGFIYPDK